MASSKEYVDYIIDQASDAGTVTCKKMFGEYGLYCEGVFIAMVCDDQLFCKVTDEGRETIRNTGKEEVFAPPYKGAKPILLIEDVEDREFLSALFLATERGIGGGNRQSKKIE